MDEQLDRNLRNALEVILFSVTEPISSYQIAKILEEGGYTSGGEGLTPGRVEKLIELLVNDWDAGGRPLTVLRIAGGYQMATRPEWMELVGTLQDDRRSHRLSRAALETLAIIAYRQPVIRPDIDAIRGVNSDSSIKTLLERGLVAIAGRDEGPGRPLLYRTTSGFLKYFGLNRVEDLPGPEELASILGLHAIPEAGPADGEGEPETRQAELQLRKADIEPLPDVDELEIVPEETGDEEDGLPGSDGEEAPASDGEEPDREQEDPGETPGDPEQETEEPAAAADEPEDQGRDDGMPAGPDGGEREA